MRIGLFGGSFDPAHEGHVHVAETALSRLGLHQVWWLVTPQNPLKAKSRPLAARVISAAALTRGSRMRVSDFETSAHLRFTVQTIAFLKRRYPGVRFVWVSGADVMAGFHHWRKWRTVFRSVPILIVARPGAGAKARAAQAFATFAQHRRTPNKALVTAPAPAWGFQPSRLHPVSSSMLRRSVNSGAGTKGGNVLKPPFLKQKKGH
jgi:nicotinate-nucleotide adenylyltransferase